MELKRPIKLKTQLVIDPNNALNISLSYWHRKKTILNKHELILKLFFSGTVILILIIRDSKILVNLDGKYNIFFVLLTSVHFVSIYHKTQGMRNDLSASKSPLDAVTARVELSHNFYMPNHFVSSPMEEEDILHN